MFSSTSKIQPFNLNQFYSTCNISYIIGPWFGFKGEQSDLIHSVSNAVISFQDKSRKCGYKESGTEKFLTFSIKTSMPRVSYE